jgi:hypothetical protein
LMGCSLVEKVLFGRSHRLKEASSAYTTDFFWRIRAASFLAKAYRSLYWTMMPLL